MRKILMSALILGVLVSSAHAASTKFTCGTWSCNAYFSKKVTKQMSTPAGYAAAVGAMCGNVKHPKACGAVAAAIAVGSVKANECSAKNQCLRVRVFSPPIVSPPFLYCTPKKKVCSNR